tara:strand:+ start:411 stop:1034 length:624 start_codon:yes stop_codon:yes gene_type:complete
MNKLAIPLIAALSLAATPVLAGHKHRHRDYYPAYDPYYPPQAAAEPRYAPQTIEYADVISAQPIYRSVRIEQPRRECWDERVVREEHRGGPWFNNGVAGSAIGAIAGGVAGHQFGKGRGKDAATVIGAVIGAGIGQRVALENSAPRETVQHVGYEQVCQTVVEHTTEQRIDGYDISYQYGGRTYHTRMPYDPGARIPVDVNVRPVSY